MQDPAPTLASERYRVARRLGRGGMATVYQVWDEALGAWRAVKVLDAAQGARARGRFENEARAMARLRHPNVLTVHDVGEDAEGRPYLVMELAPGGSLAEVMARSGRLPARVATQLVRQALAGLQHAHEHGIVHRDVKPQNILLSATGEPLVADFGIARLESIDQTATGAAIGTLAYMAPEQRSSARRVDARADVYAAAGTLFALVTGREPLDLYVERSDWEGVPEPLVPVLRRATAWDPGDRHPDARALAAELLAVEEALPEVPPGFTLPLPDAMTLDPPAAEGGAATFEVDLETAPSFATTGPVDPPPRRRWLLGAGIVAVLAAGIATWGSRDAAPVRWAMTRVAVDDVRIHGVGWSADGALHYVAGGRLWREPVDGERADLGAWSEGTFDVLPDGGILATDWWAERAVRRFADGEATEELPVAGRLAHVSADGTRIAALRGGRLEVSSFPDGGDTRVLGSFGKQQTVYDLAWSADGRWVSTAARQASMALQLWPVEEGAPVTVVEDPRMLSPLRTTVATWLAVDRLWYARSDGDDAVMEELRLDRGGQPTGPAREVARWEDGPWPIMAASSRKDARVAVLTAHRQHSLWIGEGADLEQVREVPLPGVSGARWTADGRIAAAGRDGVVVMREGEPPVPLDPEAGTRVVVAGDALLVERPALWGEERPLVRVPLAGGETTALPNLSPNALVDCNDAGRCVVAEPWGVVFELRWLDPATGERGERITNVALAREDMAQLALSPSGERVAIFEVGPEAVLIETATGITRRLDTSLAFVQHGAFSRDERLLHVIGNTGTGWAVGRVPLDGDEPEVAPAPGESFAGLDVAASGEVLFVRSTLENALWVLAPEE